MKNSKTTTKDPEKDLNTMLIEFCQKKDISDCFSEMKVRVEKIIAERKSSSYVPDEKLQATITL